MLQSIIKLFGFTENEIFPKPFGNGLINSTWLVEYQKEQFILQKINDQVFINPEMIADNIHLLKVYFQHHFPAYFFVSPIASLTNTELVFIPEKGYFRMFKFVKGSVTFDTIDNPIIAYEAAKQFGKFTRLLSLFDANSLHVTLPNFHNLTLRYQQFETTLLTGNKDRIKTAKSAIAFIKSHKEIVSTFDKIKLNKKFKKRVTHHDSKISNVLFDKNNAGICVIDLDTVMQGYFISDVGDMIRTYVSPVSEEEKDFSKIQLREQYFMAIVKGYLSEMKNELSDDEKKYFVFAGSFMIYLQAIRFLTDYLNGDIYYGSKYEGQNLMRCKNQLELLKQLLAKEYILQAMIIDYLA